MTFFALVMCGCLLIVITRTQGVLPCTQRLTQPACTSGGGASSTGAPCKCGWRQMSCEASDCQSCRNAGCKWCGLVTGEGYCALPTAQCSASLPMRTDCSTIPGTTTTTTALLPTLFPGPQPPTPPRPTPLGATPLPPTPSPTPSPTPQPTTFPTPVPEPTMRGSCSSKTTTGDCAQTVCNYNAPPFGSPTAGRCVWNSTTSKCNGCAPPCHHIKSCAGNTAVGPQGYCPDGTPCVVDTRDPFSSCLPCNSRTRDVEQLTASCECLVEDSFPISLVILPSSTVGSPSVDMTGDSDTVYIIVGIIVSALLFAAFTVVVLWMLGRRKQMAASRGGANANANGNATKPNQNVHQHRRDTSSRPVMNQEQQQQYDVVPGDEPAGTTYTEFGTGAEVGGKYVTMVVTPTSTNDSGQYDMMPMDRT